MEKFKPRTDIKLFDYQERIAQDKDKNLLFLQAGAGKTFISLRKWQLSDQHKLLVIALASKVREWKYDVQHFAASYGMTVPPKSISARPGQNGNKEIAEKQLDGSLQVAITSYESVAKKPELLNWVDRDTFIIIDESHKIKNPSSAMTRSTLKLTRQAGNTVLLTATPQNKGYIDFYSQLKAAGYEPWLKMTKKQWMDKYAKTRLMDMGGFKVPIIVGYQHEDELKAIINKRASYYEPTYDYGEPIIKVYDETNGIGAYGELRKERVYKDEIYDTPGAFYLALRKAAMGIYGKDLRYPGRVNKVAEMLTEELADTRVVIFYNWNVELHYLKQMLKELKRPFSEYNGHVQDLTAFDNEPNAVALVNYGSGSTGLNAFVKANHTIFFSLPSNHITFHQAKKRTDRIGQKKLPVYYVFDAKGTVEDAVYKSLSEGKDFDEGMFEDWLTPNTERIATPRPMELYNKETKTWQYFPTAKALKEYLHGIDSPYWMNHAKRAGHIFRYVEE